MHRTALLVALLIVAPVGPCTAEETEGRSMTVEDLWAMERISNPTLSPDGKWIAFTVTAYSMDDNEGNADLWLLPSNGSAPPKRLTWNDGPDSSPAWSPDGGRIAFVSKRGADDAPQLYVLAVDGGEARRVTDLPVGVEDGLLVSRPHRPVRRAHHPRRRLRSHVPVRV